MIAEKRNIHTNGLEDSKHQSDWMAIESYLTIRVNGQYLTSFAASPDHCPDLAVGFLFTSGIITTYNQIKSLTHNSNDARVEIQLQPDCEVDFNALHKRPLITSGCGGGVLLNASGIRNSGIHEKIQIDPELIHLRIREISAMADWYKKTGCVHVAALFPTNRALLIREDIGRHNAVDKVIGAALVHQSGFRRSMLFCSGRISSDMCLKAAVAKIPIVVSRTAPTTMAMDIAEQSGMTLIGFARGRRMNIYTHSDRIVTAPQCIRMVV